MLIAGAAVTGQAAQQEADPPRVVITLDRESGIYEVGETVAFTVRLENADARPVQGTMRVLWNLSRDGGDTSLPGQWLASNGQPETWVNDRGTHGIELVDAKPETLTYVMDKPGFIRLNATGRVWQGERTFRRGVAAAACEPHRIEPVVTMPEDFDAFWASGRERLAAIPLDPRQERIEHLSDEQQDTYLVSFAGLNGTRVYGFMLVPKGEQERYPALVSVAPAGVGRPLEGFVKDRLDRIASNRAICLYMGVHNVVPGKAREFYADYVAENWRITVEQPEDYFWYQAVLGIDRAVTWLATREDVDPDRIVYKGNSQGGGVGLALTALNKHISAASINIPGFCDLLAFLDDGRAPGWGAGLDYHRRRQLSQEDLDRAIALLPYFDGVNFARRISVPVLFAMGFRDTTCPPTGIYAAYNMLSGPKEMIALPEAEHHVRFFAQARTPWIRQQLGLSNEPDTGNGGR